MSEAQPLFAALRQSAKPDIVDALERLVHDAPDRKLGRVNALAFAASEGLDEEQVINGFLHASRLGLFEMSWNILCPGCGGVLDANTSLKTVQNDVYNCALCAAGYEPTLDEMVEVTFTVNPRVRHIEAHNPHELPPLEYFRQIYWGSGIDLPDENYQAKVEEFVLEVLELPAGEKAVISLQLPEARDPGPPDNRFSYLSMNARTALLYPCGSCSMAKWLAFSRITSLAPAMVFAR